MLKQNQIYFCFPFSLSGLGQHSPLEMLSATGLINYFGRIENLNEINISPLLLEKGKTKIALYGLSSVKDERLYRLFRENKVSTKWVTWRRLYETFILITNNQFTISDA